MTKTKNVLHRVYRFDTLEYNPNATADTSDDDDELALVDPNSLSQLLSPCRWNEVDENLERTTILGQGTTTFHNEMRKKKLESFDPNIQDSNPDNKKAHGQTLSA